MHFLGAEYSKIPRRISMLLSKDIHPANSLYFNGAYIIKALKKK